ncbi:hypothetical protein PRK78_001143 [Emydomyces testavorans]|uniref:AHC1-like C2H2 zinc-finger domain-containing protein n=1 Tax=Emydomyces testavorans TaxID=2070801 RepID=A0AAF0DCF3_9EURO|nr:hypothetical protein PRK78_001143 [Emydomyces testavorans]
MFRLIPWSIGGDKVTAEEVKMLAVPKQKSSTVVGPAPHKLKRRRTNSSESGQARGDIGIPSPTIKTESFQQLSAAQNNTNTVEHQVPLGRKSAADKLPSSTVTTKCSTTPQDSQGEGRNKQGSPPEQPNVRVAPSAASLHKMDIDTLRQTLEVQLNLEILLKHNELRLIDQEIAKCQIALEQLRRTSEIPYPASSVSGLTRTVSDGTGFAVPQPGTGRQPISPSPWGVTEGPYSRHYARWLLPDPRFDGGDPEPLPSTAYAANKGLAEGRTTRGSWAEGASRSQRSTAGAKLQALSSGYPPPKDKAGPMIMKRKSDGKFVKLVCLDCRRDNFSSTQGFINHCRIAHNRSFASHDAAATASGEPVEFDESGAVIGGNSESASNAPPGFVHPLIRSAYLLDSTARDAIQKRAPSKVQREDKTPNTLVARNASVDGQHCSITESTPRPRIRDMVMNPDFKASSQTPHLSALMERKGLGLDLLNLVDDALTKADIDSYSSDNDSIGDAMDVDTQPNDVGETQHNFRSTRLPARTVIPPMQSQRPSSRKGSDKGSRKVRSPAPLRRPPDPGPYRSPYIPVTVTRTSPRSERHPVQSGDIEMTNSNSPNLSPNTVESNQAPSLVSDDDDEYEVPSESGSPSPPPSESGHDNITFDNIEVQDSLVASGDGSTTSTTSVDYSETKQRHFSAVSQPPTTSPMKTRSLRRNRTSGPIEKTTVKTEQKHVAFVSPSVSPVKEKKANSRKPRRK